MYRSPEIVALDMISEPCRMTSVKKVLKPVYLSLNVQVTALA